MYIELNTNDHLNLEFDGGEIAICMQRGVPHIELRYYNGTIKAEVDRDNVGKLDGEEA